MSRSHEPMSRNKVGEGCYSLALAGQQLSLLPERAVYWQEKQILFVADLHLGKDATFRQAGMAVPAVSSRDSLNRLQKLIESYQPSECVILGDLIHAADSLNERVHAEISDFFQRVVDCKWRLIKGNHDRHTKKWPEHWPLSIETEGVDMLPFRLLHIPPLTDEPMERSTKPRGKLASDMNPKGGDFFLAGHLHPAWRGTGTMLVREKLACFWLTSGGLVLPAFGTFTGTKVINTAECDRIFVIADTRVIEV